MNAPINAPINDLCKVLSRMTAGYDDYYRLLVTEQELIVGNRIAELRDLVARKEEMTEILQAAEEERLNAFRSAALHLNVEVKGATLADLARKLPAGEGKALLSARDAFKAVVARVKALNGINTQLLNDSMEYVRHAFERVAGKVEKAQGYGAAGMVQVKVDVRRNLINTRA